MQRNRFATARVWLGNAETDLELAREILERFAARACFHAQQCSGFALKGALIALADDHPRTHVGEGLLRELEALDVAIPEDVLAAANRLDLFYIGSRYPDSLGGADPRKVLSREDAERAIMLSNRVLEFATALVDKSVPPT